MATGNAVLPPIDKNYNTEDIGYRHEFQKANFEAIKNWNFNWGFLRNEYRQLYHVQPITAAPNQLAEEVDKALGIRLPPITYYPSSIEAWRIPPTMNAFYGFEQRKPDNIVMEAAKKFDQFRFQRHSMEYWGLPTGCNE